MYLVTILPGPRESTQEQFNNLIDPLIDDFRDIWNMVSNILALPTPATPCDVSAAIVPLVADLLASRKAVGAKPAATRKNGFCAMVYTQKMKRMMMMCHLSGGVYLLRNGDIECRVGMNRQH